MEFRHSMEFFKLDNFFTILSMFTATPDIMVAFF